MFFGLIITVIIIYTTQGFSIRDRSDVRYAYNNASCKDNYRMIRYDDLVNLHSYLFVDPLWINASGEYTPWVVYKGQYSNINNYHILNSTKVFPGKQFTTCIQFCSVYNWLYIGLQVHKCYCLSSEVSQNAIHSNSYASIPCRPGFLPQCALNNQDNGMAVYQKDKLNVLNANEVGECLITPAINVYRPTDCQATKAYVACVNNIGSYTYSQAEKKRENSLSYCSHIGKVADFSILRTTEPTFTVDRRRYWVSNFRESLILNRGNSKNNQRRQHCVIAQAYDGKIQLKISNCSEKHFVLCVSIESETKVRHQQTTQPNQEQQNITPKSTIDKGQKPRTTRKISDRQGIMQDFTTDDAHHQQTTHPNHEQQSITPYSKIDEGSEAFIIIGVFGGCFVVLLMVGIIIAQRKRYFHRSVLNTQNLPFDNAVVQNERGITSGSEDLRDTDENVNTSEENTYDHTNTRRPSLPNSTSRGLYDTMATVQEIVTGEPVYQDSSHRPSTSHQGNSQAADPLYDHMTN